MFNDFQAKEMQRAEMEELRHREANNTALQAIGPRKKAKLDNEATTSVVSFYAHAILSFSTNVLFLDDNGSLVRHQSKHCTATTHQARQYA